MHVHALLLVSADQQLRLLMSSLKTSHQCDFFHVSMHAHLRTRRLSSWPLLTESEEPKAEPLFESSTGAPLKRFKQYLNWWGHSSLFIHLFIHSCLISPDYCSSGVRVCV